MRDLSFFLISIFFISLNVYGQDNIADARSISIGSTVTVTGIVSNGSELGSIRYMQDETGGIAVYSDQMANITRGDEVTVTGILKAYYSLLEIDPVTSVEVISTGNSLEPVTLTPGQFSEAYEGMLVKVEEAEFEGAGTFERAAYGFIANGENGQLYINDYTSPLIGEVIPVNPVTITGPLGAYNDTYQILPRDSDDIISSSSINFTSPPVAGNLSISGFSISWSTDSSGTSQALYGTTNALELGIISAPGEGTEHLVEFSGLNPSEIIYYQPFSVRGNDTAMSDIQAMITASVSSGEMKAFFTNSVDTAASLGLLQALYLDNAIDDTLIRYIERAKETIDISVYSFNNTGLSDITGALNDAYGRGVKIRVVYDGNIDADGVAGLDASIGKIASPLTDYPNYGIMHNKFVVFDALSDDPDQPVLWTGGTNLSGGQINMDQNNVVVIQDKSLAMAYRLEFNEMFGSEGLQPDPFFARFGPDKSDNTPHEFIINGKRVECYFSPSDGTHNKILDAIETAQHEIQIAAMLITKTDIGDALYDKNESGVDVKLLLNGYDQYGEPIVDKLKPSLRYDLRMSGESGIMHHKYMIIDQAYAESDPVLLTGSHNWSGSAQYRNDENTLIIHDQGMANAFYQEYVERFSKGEPLLPLPECKDDIATTESYEPFNYSVLSNDILPGAVDISICKEPGHGSAIIESDKSITYTPDAEFNHQNDTLCYKVCLAESTEFCDSAFFIVAVDITNGMDNREQRINMVVYPNPAKDVIRLDIEGISNSASYNLRILDQTGRVVHTYIENSSPAQLSLSGFSAGYYFIELIQEENSIIKPLIIK